MSEDRVRAKIANVTLDLPVYRDTASTLVLAEEVGALVASMEEGAGRIDSQAFALRAAYEFAHRLKSLEAENEADQRELIKALDGAASALTKLVETYDEES